MQEAYVHNPLELAVFENPTSTMPDASEIASDAATIASQVGGVILGNGLAVQLTEFAVNQFMPTQSNMVKETVRIAGPLAGALGIYGMTSNRFARGLANGLGAASFNNLLDAGLEALGNGNRQGTQGARQLRGRSNPLLEAPRGRGGMGSGRASQERFDLERDRASVRTGGMA